MQWLLGAVAVVSISCVGVSPAMAQLKPSDPAVKANQQALTMASKNGLRGQDLRDFAQALRKDPSFGDEVKDAMRRGLRGEELAQFIQNQIADRKQHVNSSVDAKSVGTDAVGKDKNETSPAAAKGPGPGPGMGMGPVQGMNPDASLNSGMVMNPAASMNSGMVMNPAASMNSGMVMNPAASMNPGMMMNPAATMNPGMRMNPGTTKNPAATMNPGMALNPGMGTVSATAVRQGLLGRGRNSGTRPGNGIWRRPGHGARDGAEQRLRR